MDNYKCRKFTSCTWRLKPWLSKHGRFAACRRLVRALTCGGRFCLYSGEFHSLKLHKYGMDSIDAIADLVKNGKNAMPAYKDRLSNQQILDISAYVLEQAEKGWN